MLQLFQKYNPVRSVCWRLDRVLRLIENQPFPRRPSRVDDDRYIRAYYYFLLENRCTDWKSVDRTPANPDLALLQAHLLRWSRDAEDRAILEARLLARETDTDIGRKLGILPEAVDWFEALFFCVRDKLESPGWVIPMIHSMAGPPLPFGPDTLTEQQRHTAYRLFGYTGGRYVLDAMIGALGSRPPTLSPEDSLAWLDDAWRTKLRQTAMMATATFNRKNMHRLFRIHLRLIKQKKIERTPPLDLKKNVLAMLENLKCLEGIGRAPNAEQGHEGDGQTARRSGM